MPTVQRFARIFVEGPESLPSDADCYKSDDRYYFKLRIDDVDPSIASEALQKTAATHEDMEVVRRVIKDGVYKERVYIDDPSQAPDDKKVRQGSQGGIYYETGVQQVAAPDDEGSKRNVAIVDWEDVNPGDDIVYRTPGGNEVFAEIADVDNRPDEADIVYVEVDDDVQRATPGTYTVDKGVTKVIPANRVRKVLRKAWNPYEGPRGGVGWRHTATGEVRYQREKPTNDPAEEIESESLDAAREPPEDGYADGWQEPYDDPNKLQEGQAVEWWDGNAYLYGDVEFQDGDQVLVEEQETGESFQIDANRITATEEVPEDTAPNPDEDKERFREDEFAQDLIDTVNSDPEEGFTLKRNLEPEDVFNTDVYYVGITSANFSKEDGISKDDVIDFYDEWLDLLQEEPGLRIGGYSFPEGDDKISIDLSAAVADKEEAVELGERLNQESVANLARMDFPKTGGDGEPVVESPEEVKEVLDDIQSLTKMDLVGKQAGMVDPDAVYVGVQSGVQLSGRQIAYSGLKGQRDVEVEGEEVVVDGEVFKKAESDDEKADFSSPVYSEGSDEDDEEYPHEEFEKEAQGAWVYYFGPQNGEGWINTMTGEVRYQKKRPGPPPEDPEDRFVDDEWLAEGWDEPPADLDELYEGQKVEFEDHLGELHEGTFMGMNDEGYYQVDASGSDFAGDVASVGDNTNNSLTAIESEEHFKEDWYEDFMQSQASDMEISADELRAQYESSYTDNPDAPIPDEFQELAEYIEKDEPVHLDIPVYDEPVEAELTWLDAMPNSDMEVAQPTVMTETMIDAKGLEETESYLGDIEEISPGIQITDPEQVVELQEDEFDTDYVEEGGWTEYEEYIDADFDDSPTARVPAGFDASQLEQGDIVHVYDSFDNVEVTGRVDTTDTGKFEVTSIDHPHESSLKPGLQENTHLVGVPEEYVEDEPSVSGEAEGPNEEEEAEEGGDSEIVPGISEEDVDEAVAHTTGPDVPDTIADDPNVASKFTSDYDMTQMDPEDDVMEWGSLSDYGYPSGVTAHAMEVGELPDYDETNPSPQNNRGLVFKTDYGPGADEADPDLGRRQMVTFTVGEALGGRMPTHVGHPDEDGHVISQGVDGDMAQDATGENVEEVDFVEQAAIQLILGNNDAHSHNMLVDPNGNVWAIDIDHSAGDMGSDFTGNKSWYDNAVDRALGELAKSADALGFDGEEMRQKILNRAEMIAKEHVEETSVGHSVSDEVGKALKAADEYDEDLALNVHDNLIKFAKGEIEP
jgi:hypothetical protein